MKKFVFAILIVLIGCKEQPRECYMTYYVMPKSIVFGPGTLSIEDYSHLHNQYGLLKQSFYVPYDKRKYRCITKADSICEYFSYTERFDSSSFKALIASLKETDFKEFPRGFTRIVLVLDCGGEKQTLKIDNSCRVKYNNEIYTIDSLGLDLILRKVPPEIKENWMFDLGDIHSFSFEDIPKGNMKIIK
jgi:hypothetical protein